MPSTVSITTAQDQKVWDDFIAAQRYRPFLQSWTMGDVYADLKQELIRLAIHKDGTLVGVCFAHVVPARRGRHLSVPYGPLFAYNLNNADFDALLPALVTALKEQAAHHACAFVRMSPFLTIEDGEALWSGMAKASAKTVASPLHLLAEHLWYLPLTQPDAWTGTQPGPARTEEEILMAMRKTTRNLIRRAEKDGVTIEASPDPVRDLDAFIALHDETRKRHGFTPYSNAFFRAQVKRFAPRGECTLYLAKFEGKVIASSIHMHAFGETSYHHGASADAYKKIPSSYLLQWTAIRDALKRGDRVYNFWGIAPTHIDAEGHERAEKGHPFAGVTLFKTGFGGAKLSLASCRDLPLKPSYHLTRAFEVFRKWKRGF